MFRHVDVLAGEVTIPADTRGWGSLPAALNDSDRRQYAYWHGTPADLDPLPTLERPVPFFVALLISPVHGSDAKAQIVPNYRWSATEQRFPQARILRCPAAYPRRSGHYPDPWTHDGDDISPTLRLSIGDIRNDWIWPANIDYFTNGGLLGFHYDQRFGHRRYRGRLAAVQNSSRMVLCGDAGGWAPACIPTHDGPASSISLSDALSATPEFLIASSFDMQRHAGRANILFVDSHVESVDISARSFSQIDVLRR